MKVKKITKKLTLNMLTVANLNSTEQQAVKGGAYYTELFGGAECRSWHPVCFTKPLGACHTEYIDCEY
jgi:hypothetical protein